MQNWFQLCCFLLKSLLPHFQHNQLFYSWALKLSSLSAEWGQRKDLHHLGITQMDTSQISSKFPLSSYSLWSSKAVPKLFSALTMALDSPHGSHFSVFLVFSPILSLFLVLFSSSRLRERFDQLIIHALGEAIPCHINDVLLLGVILLLPHVGQDLQELRLHQLLCQLFVRAD